MKHFITGGSGFFGSYLLRKLLAEGEEIIVYDKENLDKEFKNEKNIIFINGDILNLENLIKAMEGVDFVHHNAAVLPISRSGKTFWKINVEGTQNVLEAALKNNVKKILNVSTSAVYGIPNELPLTEKVKLSPFGDYGRAKYDAEQICIKFREKSGLDLSIVRPRTIVGAGRLGIFGIFFDWIRSGKKVYIIGKGNNLYQFISARDLAEACYLMTKINCKNEDFNIGAEEYGPLKKDLGALAEYAKTGAKIQPTNAFLVRNALRIVDFLKISPLVDYHYNIYDKSVYFDISKAKKILGWQPKDSNIKMFIEAYDWYLKNHKDLHKSVGTTHKKIVKGGILNLLKKIS